MVLKPHVAINVKNLRTSVEFYRQLFGVEPAKVRPKYAKFDLAEPALNFTLNETETTDRGINHLGIQVNSTDEVLAAKERLQKASLATFDEMNTDARQDKIWVTSPDEHAWEVFVVKGDAEETESHTAKSSVNRAKIAVLQKKRQSAAHNPEIRWQCILPAA